MVDKEAVVTDGSLETPSGDAAPATAAPVARKPLLLVLVGIPGSGKSTLAARLREEGWAVVSQDALGDRRSCESATARHLREGRDTVIDRCNFDVRQRATWLQVANAVCGGPTGFVPVTLRLATDFAECRRRVLSRTDHPTLNAGPESAIIIDRFQQDFVGPKAAEGFAARFVARSQHDIELLLSVLLEAAADEGAALAAVPSDLLDSDADPCYGRGYNSVPRPAWQQRGRGCPPWQQLRGGRAPTACNAQGRGWQHARPRPPAGQLWQQRNAQQQQWTTPQQGAGQTSSWTSTGAALPGVWRAPVSAPVSTTTHGKWPKLPGDRQPNPGSISGEQASHRPAAPSPSEGTGDVHLVEQRVSALQINPATCAGRQRPVPPPYRPPGW